MAYKESDLDLAFIVRPPIDNITRWEIEQALSVEINRTVDLVDLEQASDVFKFQIVTTGSMLFQSEDFNLYFDQIYLNYLQLNDDRKEILQHVG